MTPTLIALLVGSQVLLAASQISLKHAMNVAAIVPRPWPRVILHFGAFLGMMTFWFLLWLGFLQTMPLSKVLPWEGLSPVFLVFGAALFLREKITRDAWIGVTLISAGVVLVSLS